MDINIYNDLDTFDCAVKLEELEKENTSLKENVQDLEKKLDEKTKRVIELEKLSDNLKINISKLFKTSRAEIERKDKFIAELRYKNDNFAFRRQSRYYSHQANNDENPKHSLDDGKINEYHNEFINEEWKQIEAENHTRNKQSNVNLQELKYSSFASSDFSSNKRDYSNIKTVNKLNILKTEYISINTESSGVCTTTKINKENETDSQLKNEVNSYDRNQTHWRKKSISPYRKESKYLQEKRSNRHINSLLDERKIRERSRSLSEERKSCRNKLKRRDRSHSSDKYLCHKPKLLKINNFSTKRNHSYRNSSRSPTNDPKKYKYERKSESRNKNYSDRKERSKSKSKEESFKCNLKKNQQIEEKSKHVTTEQVKLSEPVDTNDCIKINTGWISFSKNKCNGEVENAVKVYSNRKKQTSQKTEYKTDNLTINIRKPKSATTEQINLSKPIDTNDYIKSNTRLIDSSKNKWNEEVENAVKVYSNREKQTGQETEYKIDNLNTDISAKKQVHLNSEYSTEKKFISTEKRDDMSLNELNVKSEEKNVKTEILKTNISNCNQSKLSDPNEGTKKVVSLEDIVPTSELSVINNCKQIISEYVLRCISSPINKQHSVENKNNHTSPTEIKMRDNTYSKTVVNPNKIRITVRKTKNNLQ